jgi:two-component system response regulator (stage 0 sporulation protein F)
MDDEEHVLIMLQKLLEKSGYEVEVASDGKEGTEKYSKNPPDLVIVDIFMPEKDGLSVILELRRDYPDAKIIAISGVGIRNDVDIVKLTKQYGANQAFEKPFENKDLLEAVADLLEG